MPQKAWKIQPKAPQEFFKQFHFYHPIVLQLLYNRGLKTKEDIEDFFSIDYEKDVHNPYFLSGMKKAVLRIKKALKNQEKIAIFGDYDADGICATTILNQFFLKLGKTPLIYIPSRKDGYGLNKKAIKQIARSGVSLIITVDCGISNYEEIVLAKKLGMNVIVTDHHLLPSRLPPAYVIIDPYKKRDPYPNKYLSGTGVAFKLASALMAEYPDQFKQGEEKWFLDLVAIATVADMMKLIGENRTLVKYGLLVLAKTRRLGLKALLKKAGVKNIQVKWIDRKKHRFSVKNINAYTIGFVIGPRLNAAGRMDHADVAFYLLNTQSKREAQKLATILHKKNLARQKTQLKIIKEIKKGIKITELKKKHFILEENPHYPKGIVGLVSGKLTDEFYVPSFICQREGKSLRGSCRSIPEINIVKILEDCSNYLKEFGGHKGAAGFSLELKNFHHFEKCLEKTIHRVIGFKKLVPKLEIDLILNFRDINYSLKKILEELEPFGQGNREPLFMIKKALVIERRKVGQKEEHLYLRLKKIEQGKDYYLKALIFKNTANIDGIEKDKYYDFVFVPLFDEWHGRKQVSLKIVDWQETGSKERKVKSAKEEAKSRKGKGRYV